MLKNKQKILVREGDENIDVKTTVIHIGLYRNFINLSTVGEVFCNVLISR